MREGLTTSLEQDSAGMVEGVVGAVYVDSGFDVQVVREVMGRLALECPVDARGDGGGKAVMGGKSEQAADVR